MKQLVIGAVLAACVSTGVSRPKTHHYFISIDGLQPKRLQTLLRAGALDEPHGLGALYNNSYTTGAHSVVTTMTASSHISTITCSPPSRHGIVSNGFFRNGESVNGFRAEFKGEPMWRAAMRQGKKVLALAYVGADGNTEQRSASWGLAYPSHELLGESQTLAWDYTGLRSAAGWTLSKQERKDLKSGSFSVILNPQTKETISINFLVHRSSQDTTMFLDTDKNLVNGYLGELSTRLSGERAILSTYFREQDSSSDLVGRKRHIFMRMLPNTTTNELRLYVSGSSYNNAYPEAFRASLDAADLVWPKYGISDEHLDRIEKLESQAMIDRFLTKVAIFAQQNLAFDIMLFYQPLIDSTSHKLEGLLPEPYAPLASDIVSATYTRAHQIVDRNLSELLKSQPHSIAALMGDHGMARIEKKLNLSALLSDSELNSVRIKTSGSMALLYSRDGNTRAVERIGRKLKSALEATKIRERAVLAQAHRRLDYSEANWHYADASWVFLPTEPIWFTHRVGDKDLFIEPSIYGMHGQPANDPSMETIFMLTGPGIPKRHNNTVMSLIHAVPSFFSALGLENPQDCQGQSIPLDL